MDQTEGMGQIMVGVCPNCGKPFRIEPVGGGEGWAYCADVCTNPAAMPTGETTRLSAFAGQATTLYTDGNMQEFTREDYIKTHGIDPFPVWEAIKKWREEQIKKWKK